LHTPQEPVTGPVPLTPIQHWFFARHPIDVHHFNQAVMLAIQPSVSPGLLEQAVQYVLGYHDALRLRYRLTATGWQQIIVAPGVTVPYEHIDVSALAPGDHRRVIEAVATRLQASLHLEAGPLVRVAYFTLGAHQPGRLLLIIHHLAVDGVSWRILLTDLHQACAHLRYGEAIQLAPQTTSIKAWAEWLHTYAQSAALRQVLDYWGMVPPTPVCRLPVDYTGRANTVGSARVVTVTLSPRETHALLQEIPHAYHTRINDVLLTALLQAFACWTGTRALLLDLEGHGREDLCDAIDLSRTVGWFTSLFPLWLELGTVTTPGEALLVIKDQLRRLPQHGIGYGVLRYLSQEEEITRRLCALPQAEVCFNYLGQLDRVLPALSLFTLAPESSGAHRSQRGLRQYLLEINASVNREQLHVHWTYSEHVHRRDTIAGVAQAFLEALRTLITHCQSPTAGGYTHADFPLAQLGRQQLEQAFDEIIFAEEEA
jgi:non-ribosomal peptide synthase protein (TIGR01720 family)